MKAGNRLWRFMLVLLLLFVSSLAVAKAEPREIIAEGTYIMSNSETFAVAQERAILNAKRLVVEQAGTYLESFTEVKNMKLASDEVRILASGIIETTVIDRKRDIVDGENIKIWVKVRCIVKIENLQNMRARLQNQAELEKLKKVQEDYIRLMRENDELKTKLAQAETMDVIKQLQAELVRNEQAFTAVQWVEKGFDFIDKQKDYARGIAAFGQAITLNPQYIEAYINRGVTYALIGQPDLAMADYDKAIALNPQYALTYFNRGNLYARKGEYGLAIADYEMAVTLNPKYAMAYFNHGNVYAVQGSYDLAIASLTMAITLEPEYAPAYNSRGSIYGKQGQYDLAIADYNRAIALSPQDFRFRFNIAATYDDAGRKPEAIAAYRQFITLAPPQASQQIEYAKKRIAAFGG